MKKKIILMSMLLLVLTIAAVSGYAQEEQQISIISMEQGTIVINVENIAVSGVEYYVIYDANHSTESDKIPADETRTVTYAAQNGAKLQISSYDESDSLIAQSSEFTAYTEDVILDTLTLHNDIYAANLTKTTGNIDLNGFTLYVFGDAIIKTNVNLNHGVFYVGGSLTQPFGTLTINNGLLDVTGDYKITDSAEGGMSFGKLNMTQSCDRVNVGGDFVTDSISAHTGYLTDGVLRLAGNFSQLNSTGQYMMSRYNFDTDENFKIIFCGDDTQTVYFYDPKRSQFSIWEIENQSEHPLEITHGFGIRTLKQDSVIPCDVELWSHLYTDRVAPAIDLNGYTLLVKGDVMNNRVNMRISKGQLIIEGDYRLQAPRDIGDKKDVLTWTYGTLRMLYDEDYVLVMGDFYQDSYYSHSNCMLAGTLEIKGDFRQITSNPKHDTHYNFDASGSHRVILSGDGVQIVDFEDPETNQFNILEIPESNSPGHVIIFTSEWHANEIINNSTTTALLNWYGN